MKLLKSIVINLKPVKAIRRTLFNFGIVSWCDADNGIHRHSNEGLRKPSNDFVSHSEMVEIFDGVFVTEL